MVPKEGWAQRLGTQNSGLGFRVSDLGSRVQDLGFQV